MSVFVASGKKPAGLHIIDIAQSIDRDDRADHQFANLGSVAADAAFHAVLRSHQFADGAAAADTIVALRHGAV